MKSDNTACPKTTEWLRWAVAALRDAGDESERPCLSVRWRGYDRRLAAIARRMGWISAPEYLGDGPATVRILVPTEPYGSAPQNTATRNTP